jgi:hypothetical protein
MGFTVNGLGQFHILVAEQDEAAAREILEGDEESTTKEE